MSAQQSILLFLGLVLLCGAGALATMAPDDWFHPSIHSDSTTNTATATSTSTSTSAAALPPIKRRNSNDTSNDNSNNNNTTSTSTSRSDTIPRVAVDFYVMSKCPDAALCLTQYQSAVTAVTSIADVSVNYIASYDGNQFNCMHGQSECDGNLQQVCAENLFPNVTSTGSLPWFDFMACQEQNRGNIPNNGESCARTVGLDWKELNTCATGSQGTKFLVESIARTNAAKETVSCTINVDKAFWCQHNGQWVNCAEGTSSADLIHAICKRYTGTDKPAACQT